MSSQSSKPSIPEKVNIGDTTIKSNIKVASSNLFILDEAAIPVDKMTQMIFQDFGGQELTNFIRHDMVNGNIDSNQPFANLKYISQQTDPNNLIKLQGTDQEIFSEYAYKLEDYVPQVGTGPNGEIVYIDKILTSDTLNNIIINAINLTSNQRVEVEFVSFSSKKNGTIYP